jgi:hypothetical protein
VRHDCAAWRHQYYDEDCGGCRRAYNRCARDRKWRRYADRVERDGVLVAVREGLPHGSASTYSNWGCRCAPCTAAKTAEMAQWREVQR